MTSLKNGGERKALKNLIIINTKKKDQKDYFKKKIKIFLFCVNEEINKNQY